MNFLATITALFAAFAAALPVAEDSSSGLVGRSELNARQTAPSGHEIEIKGFTYGGSGCPAGSIGYMFSDDRTTLTLLYDEFIAAAGEGTQVKDRRKNCQLNLKLHYPQGWQFSIFRADYRGHVTLPKGATGTATANYFFSGGAGQITTKGVWKGPIDQDYTKTDNFTLESYVPWSPCGASGMLNINSAIQVTPLDLKKPALLTAESTDLTFKQIAYLQWRKC
ncbi:hypothetical protein VTJ83DRAFT_6186 [Remersonia thermophila]|uniref:Secreted protein n=1 Tax=Remersonia thermophila TaxID=72144 RepID=A0ABR4DB40_9PEZI